MKAEFIAYLKKLRPKDVLELMTDFAKDAIIEDVRVNWNESAVEEFVKENMLESEL
jgi:hypothetical protein